jgi:hypothetical protein
MDPDLSFRETENIFQLQPRHTWYIVVFCVEWKCKIYNFVLFSYLLKWIKMIVSLH